MRYGLLLFGSSMLLKIFFQQQMNELGVSVLSNQSIGYPTSPSASSTMRHGAFPFQNGHADESKGLWITLEAVVSNFSFSVESPKFNGDHALQSGAATSITRMGHLMSTAQDLGRAMGSLVNAVTSDDEISDDELEESHLSS